MCNIWFSSSKAQVQWVDRTHACWNINFTVSGWVVGTPLHVPTFLCRKTTAAATLMLPGYQHDHIIQVQWLLGR